MNHSDAARKVFEAREKYINEKFSDHGEMILDDEDEDEDTTGIAQNPHPIPRASVRTEQTLANIVVSPNEESESC